MPKPTPVQMRVLEVMASGEDGWCYHFAAFMNALGMDRKSVRDACRALSDAGLAVYRRGLFNDDGMTAGSGYGITPAGRAALEATERDQEAAK